MKKVVLLTLSVLCYTACKKEEQKNIPIITEKVSTDTIKVHAEKIKLDFFKSIPDTIDGCSELFTYDSINKLENNYVFVSNLDKLGIIKVNGKDIFLKKDTVNSKEISKEHFLEIYEGGGYKTILQIKKQSKLEEEVSIYNGVLEIIKNNKSQKYKIKGEIGC